ncbi:chaperonin 10-like protein [Mucidula mucida]|nr:chaperonin 10-like protein [Mucidula mucida]
MTLPTTTKEYYFPERGSYTNLRLKESAIPPLKANELLVKTHAVSLQYRDVMLANGTYPRKWNPPNLLSDDLVPCSDMAGEILAVGDLVTKWKVGDRVCANLVLDHVHGKLSAKIRLTTLGGTTRGGFNAVSRSLVAIPEHLSYEEASTLPCAAVTAYNGTSAIESGLILGTGGVSMFGLQFAVASGATDITPAWDEEVLKLTDGRGVNHVLEVGRMGTLEKSLNSVDFGGWINLIGVLAKSDTALASVLGRTIYETSNLRGILNHAYRFQDTRKLMSANPETTRPDIDKVFAFDQAIDAYAHLESQAHVGKVVIKMSVN